MKKNVENVKKINKKNVLIFLIVLLIIVIFSTVLIINLVKDEPTGNLANMGLAIESEGVIYYNKYEKGIVKVKGGKEYQITDETAYSMNIVEDTIYYLTVSDTNTIDIKSVKTNGDELKKIKTIYTIISKIYVKDGFIYYATNKDSSGLVKIDINSGEETKITLANIQDFILDEDTIYFIDNVNDLYSIKTSGLDLKKIETDGEMKKIQIIENWIYFYDYNENALCKIRKDGGSKKTVATFVNSEIYNVTNNKIFYYDSINKQISSCDLKGKSSKSIVTIKTQKTKINYVDGDIYYLDESKDETQIHQMYRIKGNGKALKTIDY